MDFETDPFRHGLRVKPFAAGLYDGRTFTSVWGKSCASTMVKLLAHREPGTIYMHNGGRFDIFFLMPWLEPEMRIINGRIVSAFIACEDGAKKSRHEIRDSFSILPMPLKAYDKIDIDIEKLKAEVRDLHREEILRYLQRDCTSLYELVTGFRGEFGDHLTVGSASMAQIKKRHPFERGTGYMDEKLRKQFYYGGRVQCFKSGLISMPFKIYDVNSMYPYVMKNCLHPTGKSYSVGRNVTKQTAFVIAEGRQIGPYGAFPLRDRKGINFTTEVGTFSVTIHEWNAAEECGFFRPSRIIQTYDFPEWICFDEFVDHFYESRKAAKAAGDKIRDIAYKFVLNSGYGKFAQNPDSFADWAITRGERRMPEDWKEHTIFNVRKGRPDYVVWKRPCKRHTYYNIAIGASITGASRATLLRGLKASTDAVYCDTDSIIASDLQCSQGSDLGQWKLEGAGDILAIAGKKLYACFDGGLNGKCIKKATKGARISEAEIVAVAQGGSAMYRKDAPTFKLDGSVQWIERRIRKTA